MNSLSSGVASIFEALLSEDLSISLIRISLFILVLVFGILLIRSVRRGIRQRQELETLTKKLESANQKLTELDKLKSEFLSFASHQIKSPVTVIKGFSSLIYDGSYGEVNEKVKETAFKMEEAADRLLNLVDEFLDMRRIEEGRMGYNFENMNLMSVVESAFNELKAIGQSKGLEMVFDKPKQNSIKIKGDPRKFHHVIQNLIDNAIKYTDKGWVKIKIRLCTPEDGSSESVIRCANENSVLLIVSDSGCGMSGNLVNNLFGKFSRGSNGKEEVKGTGLGLYIAKQVVDAHKGEIWAESEGEGKGSSFYVKLPLAEN